MNPLKNCFALLLFSIILFSCDLNEYPPQVLDQEFDVVEFSPAGTVVGFIEAHDKDEGQVISFEIIQASDEGIFEINPSDGSILVVDSEKLDSEKTKQVKLIVSVSDNHQRFGEETTAEVLINVVEFTLEVPEGGLLAFYPFNGNADDQSGNQIHGKVFGASLQEDRKGSPNNAYSFDGINDYILLEPADMLHFGNADFSISAWVKFASPEKKWQGIFTGYRSSGSNREFVLAAHSDSDYIYFSIYDSGGTQRDIIWIEKSRDWQLITITKNSSTIRAYSNGYYQGEVSVTSTMAKTSARILIGAIDQSTTSPDAYFNGLIDDVSVYNRVLVEGEIRALYQGEDLLLK